MNDEYTPDNFAEVERQLAAASKINDIAPPKVVESTTGPVADPNAPGPETFREMLYDVQAKMRNGGIWTGWDPDGVPCYGDAGTTPDADVTLLPTSHPDVPLFAGVMVMRLIDEAQIAAAARQSRIATLVTPGDGSPGGKRVGQPRGRGPGNRR